MQGTTMNATCKDCMYACNARCMYRLAEGLFLCIFSRYLVFMDEECLLGEGGWEK